MGRPQITIKISHSHAFVIQDCHFNWRFVLRATCSARCATSLSLSVLRTRPDLKSEKHFATLQRLITYSPVNFDQLTTNLCRSNMPSMQKKKKTRPTAWTASLNRSSSPVAMFNLTVDTLYEVRCAANRHSATNQPTLLHSPISDQATSVPAQSTI